MWMTNSLTDQLLVERLPTEIYALNIFTNINLAGPTNKLHIYLTLCVSVCVFYLCRWNVVGIQGSLMSYFTEPIYFSSIILGSLYHADHLSRAMYQRIADIEDLPQQFTLNRPLLSGQCLILCGEDGGWGG